VCPWAYDIIRRGGIDVKKEIQKYWEQSFEALTSEEIETIINYICEKQVSAPVLYRGINIDPDKIDVGDTIELHDMEAFVSMSPDLRYAWAFGNVVLAVEGLEGCPINEKEWLVLNTKIYVENIEYDDRNDIYIVSCR
jgi:hypothetical protein